MVNLAETLLDWSIYLKCTHLWHPIDGQSFLSANYENWNIHAWLQIIYKKKELMNKQVMTLKGFFKFVLLDIHWLPWPSSKGKTINQFKKNISSNIVDSEILSWNLLIYVHWSMLSSNLADFERHIKESIYIHRYCLAGVALGN